MRRRQQEERGRLQRGLQDRGARLSTADLPANWQSAAFTPGAAHFRELCARCGGDAADAAERALARAGLAGAEAAIAALEQADPGAQSHLARVVSRVATDHADRLRPRLLALLSHDAPRVLRAAVTGLGKIGGDGVELALLAAFEGAALPERRALVEALGKIGGAASHEFLKGASSDDPELERRRTRALLMLERSATRDLSATIDIDRPLPSPATLVLACRRGLAWVLLDEARARGDFRAPSGHEVVTTWSGALRPLLELRTALSVGFEAKLQSPGDDGIVAALTGLAPLLAAVSSGVPRFRLSWPKGHQRARSFRIAEGLDPTRLINDPRAAPFEAQIDEPNRRVVVVVRPDDELRFSYRGRDVPAASHPTIAASLARVAGVRADDVVWDPFVGSGLELCERGLLGPFAKLIGTDTSDDALRAARENASRAGLSVDLIRGDATGHTPSGVTLIITNPPMGRRIARDSDVANLLDRFIDSASPRLAAGGRLVWLSPFPEKTAQKLATHGLEVERHAPVDLGGFDAELQVATRRFTSPQAGTKIPPR